MQKIDEDKIVIYTENENSIIKIKKLIVAIEKKTPNTTFIENNHTFYFLSSRKNIIIKYLKDIDYNIISEMENINMRIKREICYNTIEKLTDKNLMNIYIKSNAVKYQIKFLKNILNNYLDNETIKQKIIQDYLIKLIPPGTKGNIRGLLFNNIIKQYINNLNLDLDRFEIFFEKKCDLYLTDEIPDWYIFEKSTNKIIIGMNQLSLWGGGQQSNRGSYYIKNNKYNDKNIKLLCVICNEIQFENKNKTYELFKIDYKNNTLCYIKNLKYIINSYFNIN